MKKLFLYLTLFYSMSFGQGWNTTVQTTINEPNIEKMDLFTNVTGNHILIKRYNGSIVYYRLNSLGVLQTSINPTPFTTSGDFPTIIGSNDVIYALYKEGNFIKGKFSTNGGNSWTSLTNNQPTTANLSNGIDAVWNDQGVHLVWATRDNFPNFETYYARLNPANNQWVEFQNVTDQSSAPYGGNPSIAVSSNRIHVSFNTQTSVNILTEYPGDALERDKSAGAWLSPQFVVSGIEKSSVEKLIVRDDLLYCFYLQHTTQGGIQWDDLNYRTRSITGTTWSSANEIVTSLGTYKNILNLCRTTDNNLNVLYSPENNGPEFGLGYKYFNGNNWSSPLILDLPEPRLSIDRGFSLVSNDLFVTWVKEEDNYIRYRQYDLAPLAPQNLTAQATPDYHPKLIWNNNTEADIQKYYVYRSTNLGYYSQIAEVNHNSTTSTQSYIDNSIFVPPPGGQAGAVYYYVVSAVDLGQHVSDYSNYVAVTSANFYLDKGNFENATLVTEYSLDQNYPNPFNPSTKISYSIKEEGLVTLKVYDILGKEIATLVNENKPEGIYEAEFNASQLPSGMYIYKIQAGSFSDVKKMLLTK